MLWKLIVARDSPEILAALILLVAVFSVYRLMKGENEVMWNFILIAVSFLAISAVLHVIERFFAINILSILTYIFMMVSSITFVLALSSASIRDKRQEIEK